MSAFMNMEAIVLAGGMGTRLRSAVPDLPKPMAPIGGKPFLEYLLVQLLRWNIKDIVLSIGYKGKVIREYFGDGRRWGLRLRYSTEDEPLGTGGAIREASRLLVSNHFWALNGDSYLDLDFDAFRAFHLDRQAALSMALVVLADTERYGRVTIAPPGQVLRFTEKGEGGPGFVNSGIYLLNRDVLSSFPQGNVSLETAVLPRLMGRGLHAMAVKAFFIDIGIPRDYFYLADRYEDIFSVSTHPKVEK